MSHCRRALVAVAAALCLAPGALAQTPGVRALGEDEIVRYLAVLDALVEQGALDPTRMNQQSSLDYSGDVKKSIEGHGFDETSFTTAHWNVMLAFAALQVEERRAEIEAAQAKQRARLEAARNDMPTEEYAEAIRSLDAMSTYLNAFKDVPKANVTLAAQHKEALAHYFSPSPAAP